MNKYLKFLLPSIIVLSLGTMTIWQFFFAESVNYYIISVSILVLSMLPFVFRLETCQLSSRELTLIATMIALAVVSRTAFYLVPQIKPIAAVVVVAGAALGLESGYIIGMFSMFISNFIFGQGLWTPFQMVAMGLIGLMAALIFRFLKPSKVNMSFVGFILTFFVYGAIVDISTIISVYGNDITFKGIVSVYAASLPFNFVFALSTALFLFLFGESFLKKINRVQVI